MTFAEALTDDRSKALLVHAQRLAVSDAAVMITGERSTGKKHLGSYIHAHSHRAQGPFVAVDCSTSDAAELERALHGYERAAFRGAFASHAGWFELADGGTLLLDEIHCLPPGLQLRLMQVLQTRQITRLGTDRSQAVDVRVMAATSLDLPSLVADGVFRSDLFYALNVVHLRTLPLRARPRDVTALARYFLRRYCERLGFPWADLTEEAAEVLESHAWPGNTRELENVMQQALLTAGGGVLGAEVFHLSPAGSIQGAGLAAAPDDSQWQARLEGLLDRAFSEMPGRVAEVVDRCLYAHAYRHCRHNQVRAAEVLGVTRNVLRGRLILYGEIDAKK